MTGTGTGAEVMPAGTGTVLRIDWDGDDHPVEGDILRSHPAGSCYLIDEVYEIARRACERRFRFHVTRLGLDAAPADGDGVWLFHWNSR